MSSNNIISIENFFEVVIIGGGPCGLAVAARLCEATAGSIYTEDEHQRFHWLKKRGPKSGKVLRGAKKEAHFELPSKFSASEILVLDAVSDSFMGQWDNQFASCQVPTLRSPMFFHPDPVNLDGMITYAYQNKREKDLTEIQNVVGKEYSKHQQKRVIKKNTKKLASPLKGESRNDDRPGLIDINMRDYRDYYRPSTKFFKDFCGDIVDRYKLASSIRKDRVVSLNYGDFDIMEENRTVTGFIVETESGKIYGCQNCVVASGHDGIINYPILGLADANASLNQACHTTHIFSKRISYPPPIISETLAQKKEASIVIVGGGLTSAQLAHISCNLGVKVTLVLRSFIKIKHFDFHLDWVTKYKNLKKSSFYMLDTDEEKLQLIHDSREGGLINPEYHKKIQKHVNSGMLRILDYSTITNAEHRDGRWNLTICENRPDKESRKFEMSTNYVLCATGIQPDVSNLEFLQPIVKDYPIDFVGGLPCLTDDLRWCKDLPLYMVGKNAALRVGPTSANLDGARVGAERVGWKIQDEYNSTRSSHTQMSTSLKIALNQENRYSVLQSVEC
ncbi:hypothetical protein METBIDRAFT_35575 [Metschnikowia bicuspidata var. bicuspidata NRRL YB-4993]|uniref:FAD/NAD(P)-binding domain-containing protein n=1 Tax=Metschnikowia bicuspidata var. bicuspidata NRRL YB-4993 TaxID=869754 RepID=A0A1A0HKK8_9ASCO|nr:hypothetical protein METBIDRAFT_35575 [Metschnikowia bicuspidata var. bicuspidata NRRL YB-4993]OBA24526.1 hypothetical protein METBIDRAFT_35575 [Metschnikowia bicuspidata var. bicuspidata NRRL YB-4993]